MQELCTYFEFVFNHFRLIPCQQKAWNLPVVTASTEENSKEIQNYKMQIFGCRCLLYVNMNKWCADTDCVDFEIQGPSWLGRLSMAEIVDHVHELILTN